MNRFFISLLLLLFINTCELPSDPTENQNPEVLEIQADYDEVTEELYVAVSVSNYEVVDSVTTLFYLVENQELIDTTVLILNDEGINGDILVGDGLYTFQNLMNEFKFGEYLLNTTIKDTVGNMWLSSNTYNFEPNYPTEILDIEFWKYKTNSNGYLIDYKNDAAFNVTTDSYSYLYFKLTIKDLNGLDDIKFVKFQINVEEMEAVDSCNYIPPSGYLEYLQWYMIPIAVQDSIFEYDILNDYLNDYPGFQYKPINECGRTGISIFKFIVVDKKNNMVSQEVPINFTKCGDQYWNCEEECQDCIEECVECD